jgi:hypothetical protein
MNQPESPPQFSKTLLVMGIICVLVVLFCFLLVAPDLPIHTLFGWCFYLNSASAKARMDFPAILQFMIATTLFLGLTHYLIRSFLHQAKTGANWQLRNSVSTLFALFASFTAGLAFVGVVHQIGWLAREPRIFHNSMEAPRRTQSRNNLKTIGLAALDYNDKWNSFPVGGTLLDRAIPGHSWQTFLLPYMDNLALFQKINLHQPWFASQNKPHFTTPVSSFKNLAIETDLNQKSDGYALSHYAANSHLAKLGESLSLDPANIPDGAGNTLLAGEVVSNFKPWGDPTNHRDPTLGLNTSPQGFGGPWKDSATGFLMGDGSTRMISKDIDPKILKALATPNGGEPVGEF